MGFCSLANINGFEYKREISYAPPRLNVDIWTRTINITNETGNGFVPKRKFGRCSRDPSFRPENDFEIDVHFRFAIVPTEPYVPLAQSSQLTHFASVRGTVRGTFYGRTIAFRKRLATANVQTNDCRRFRRALNGRGPSRAIIIR